MAKYIIVQTTPHDGQGLYVSDAQDFDEIPMASPNLRCHIHVGYEKLATFDK